jgi:hypothetical protein
VKSFVTSATVVLVTACAPAQRPEPAVPLEEATPQALTDAAAAFATLREGFLEWYFEAEPVRASELGVEGHDDRLPALDRASVQRRIDALLDWESQLRGIPLRLMRGDDRLDHMVLGSALRGALLELEEVRRWATDPGEYTDVIARGLASIAERGPVGAGERRALEARLLAAPAVLATARENVRAAPRTWTELALEHAAGLLEYVEAELPARWGGDGGAGVNGLESARSALAASLRDHMDWLETVLLPAAGGDYRLGRYLLARRLLYQDHVEASVEALARQNDEAIAAYQTRVAEVAAELDPGRSPRAVLDSVLRLHPPAGEVLAAARVLTREARDWVVASGLVSVPEQALPVVRESPGYARQRPTSLTVVAAPGGAVNAAYFNLTLPAADWDADRVRGHLLRFNRGGLAGAALRETFPGRYVQAQHARSAPGRLRQAFVPRSFVDGWSHYAEAVALEEGFGAGDPVVRLAQLQRALEAHARWHAVLQLHGLDRPEAQVVERFMEISYLDASASRREVMLAGHDPGRLLAAYGRLQILELRSAYEEHRARREESYSLREFHDRLLETILPFPLAAEALMPRPARRDTIPVLRDPRRRPTTDW